MIVSRTGLCCMQGQSSGRK